MKYTVIINKYVAQNNPKLPSTCGHIHLTAWAADKCRTKLTRKFRLAWTDATIVESKGGKGGKEVC